MVSVSQRWARSPLFALMLLTDLGFLAYWLVTALRLLPEAWLFRGYHDPVLHDWNWSFAALDVLVSASGLTAWWWSRRDDPRAPGLALVSLTLTSASGLMALSFWSLRGDFDPWWWAPNLFLAIFPLAFLPRFFAASSAAERELRAP